MTRAICAKCRGEYDKKSELDSIFCQRCQIRSNASKARIYQVAEVVCLTFGFICLVIFPVLELTSLVNPSEILMMGLVIFGVMIIFFSLFVYFKVKNDKTKIRLRELKIKPRRLFGGDE
ncbi:MAG: hypothetical protein AAB336_13650 [Acidobacteriota bacterium]